MKTGNGFNILLTAFCRALNGILTIGQGEFHKKAYILIFKNIFKTLRITSFALIADMKYTVC